MTPVDIPRMSRELTSRLTSGLVARIEQPDTETRVRILTKKAAQHGLALSSGIIHLLAEALKRDIRQMESVLKCLKAKSELLHLKIDQNLAKEVLKCFVSGNDAISLEEIKKLVCTYYKVDPEMLQSKSRKKAHATPRNIYIYLSRNHTDETLEDIAKSINRTHSTVLYATEVVEQKINNDERMGKQIHFLKQKLEEMKR
jgi:chromosomal replication initiator protein